MRGCDCKRTKIKSKTVANHSKRMIVDQFCKFCGSRNVEPTSKRY